MTIEQWHEIYAHISTSRAKGIRFNYNLSSSERDMLTRFGFRISNYSGKHIVLKWEYKLSVVRLRAWILEQKLRLVTIQRVTYERLLSLEAAVKRVVTELSQLVGIDFKPELRTGGPYVPPHTETVGRNRLAALVPLYVGRNRLAALEEVSKKLGHLHGCEMNQLLVDSISFSENFNRGTEMMANKIARTVDAEITALADKHNVIDSRKLQKNGNFVKNYGSSGLITAQPARRGKNPKSKKRKARGVK